MGTTKRGQSSLRVKPSLPLLSASMPAKQGG